MKDISWCKFSFFSGVGSGFIPFLPYFFLMYLVTKNHAVPHKHADAITDTIMMET